MIQVKTVDLLCVIIGVGETEYIKRKTGEQLAKKTFLLADNSDVSISMSVWGDESCQKFKNLTQGQVIAIKNVFVSDFGGKSLSYRERGTQIIEDYKNAEVSKLKEWYKSQTNIESIQSLTT